MYNTNKEGKENYSQYYIGNRNKKESEKQSEVAVERVKKNRIKSKIIIPLAICMLFSAYLLLVSAFYGSTPLFSRLSSEDVYYAVALGLFEDKNDALVYSNTLSLSGSANFITKAKDKYTLLVGAYPEKSAAESVIAKLSESGYSPFIHTMDIPKKAPRLGNDTEKMYLERLFVYPTEIFDLIYTMSNELSNGKTTIPKIQFAFKSLLDEVTAEYDNVSNYATENYSTACLDICVFAKMLVASLSNLISSSYTSVPDYLAEMRYYALLVVFSANNLG